MADVDHPKTHVEDQNLTEPRVQPESPQREGIDPLTESDTMYPRDNTKADSEKLAKADEKTALKADNAVEATNSDVTAAPVEARQADATTTPTEPGSGVANDGTPASN